MTHQNIEVQELRKEVELLKEKLESMGRIVIDLMQEVYGSEEKYNHPGHEVHRGSGLVIERFGYDDDKSGC